MPNLAAITDALRAAQTRGALPTSLDTAGLRELGADVLARSVFTARGTNVIFADMLKKIIDQLAAGDIGEGQARTAIWEALNAMGYDAEKGGFPGEELDPKLQGTLQDLKSFRRRDLIVRTQLDLMRGAGQKLRGSDPDRLSEFPAWELVRVQDVAVPRYWGGKHDGTPPRRAKSIDPRPRWTIAGGKPTDGRLIALKGDPIWGELGSYENFDDALGVDHPPFAFNSGMGWKEISIEETRALGITGPAGETPDEWLASAPETMSGPQSLPTPQISLNGVDPALIARFKKAVHAETGGKPYVFSYSDILATELKTASESYERGRATR